MLANLFSQIPLPWYGSLSQTWKSTRRDRGGKERRQTFECLAGFIIISSSLFLILGQKCLGGKMEIFHISESQIKIRIRLEEDFWFAIAFDNSFAVSNTIAVSASSSSMQAMYVQALFVNINKSSSYLYFFVYPSKIYSSAHHRQFKLTLRTLPLPPLRRVSNRRCGFSQRVYLGFESIYLVG